MSAQTSPSLDSPGHVSNLPAIWVNGERRAADEPHISARDRGLTLADGLFETMRLRNGRIFRLDRHLARLERGMHALQIPAVPDIPEWVARAVTAASGSGLQAPGSGLQAPGSSWEAAVRLTVTRGPGPGGLPPPAAPRPTVVITIGEVPSFPAAIYEQGLTAHVVSGRRNARAMTAGLKTLAYVDAVAGLIEAQHAGADEALFLDTDDHCSEASASNLFVWNGSQLLTPPVSCGALPGITRETVLEIASSLGLQTLERAFGLDQLTSAEEAFLTSSLRGIAPLVRIDGRSIGKGAPGEITQRVSQAYVSIVARECTS